MSVIENKDGTLTIHVAAGEIAVLTEGGAKKFIVCSPEYERGSDAEKTMAFLTSCLELSGDHGFVASAINKAGLYKARDMRN